MQNEHHTNGSILTVEYIQNYIDANKEDPEITWLVDTSNESAQETLKEAGFRYAGKRLVDEKVVAVYKWFRDLGTAHEEMGEFFDRRAEDYDLHMSDGKAGYEASFISLFRDIPESDGKINILDLGCGTGAELPHLFRKVPNARILCVDVSAGMLEKVPELYPEYTDNLETLCSSYLGLDLEESVFDYVVACNTLHHLLPENKLALFGNIRRWLKADGLLLIQDYVAETAQFEEAARNTCLELLADGTIEKDKLYHIDIPLTPEHEKDLLTSAGFTCTRLEKEGATGILVTAQRM